MGGVDLVPRRFRGLAANGVVELAEGVPEFLGVRIAGVPPSGGAGVQRNLHKAG